MSTKADRVYRGWVRLSDADRQDVIRQMNEYVNATPQRKQQIDENLRKGYSITLGPTDSSCPCCGR